VAALVISRTVILLAYVLRLQQ